MSAKSYVRDAAIAAALLVGACQSSPATHYFALSEVAPASTPAPAAAAMPIRVERVTLPGELDRLEIVRSGSAHALQIAAFDRWAAPLDEMTRRVIASDLAARLGAAAIASANEPAVGEPRRHLYIEILEFAGNAQGAVKLRAAWLLQTPSAASVRGAEDIDGHASNASSEALAAAMSGALATLSDRLAAALVPHPGSEKSE